MEILLKEVWWNLLIFSSSLLTAILSYRLAKVKRNDDLFEIKYQWFDKCVDFSGVISGMMRKHYKFIPKATSNHKLTNEILIIHTDIQRHLAKGNLLFPIKKMNLLFGSFRGDIRFIYSTDDELRFSRWGEPLITMFEIKRLLEVLGPEIKLRKDVKRQVPVESINPDQKHP